MPQWFRSYFLQAVGVSHLDCKGYLCADRIGTAARRNLLGEIKAAEKSR